jgi:hypothetical protein
MTDFPLHLFSQQMLSHFCNSKLPINLNHIQIKEKLLEMTEKVIKIFKCIF